MSRYLFNTAHALKCENSDKYFLLRYETLVRTPEAALESLLRRIGLSFEASIMAEGNPKMTEEHHMTGWRSSEIELPNQRSIGRFKSLTEKEQTDIITSLGLVQVNPDYAHKYGMSYSNPVEISESLGYAIPALKIDAKTEVMKRLRSEQRRYRQKCLAERRLFYERERPITLV